MMKFYAYLPTELGNEPRALKRRKLINSNSLKQAKIEALNTFGIRAKLLFYTNFFNRETFSEIRLDVNINNE